MALAFANVVLGIIVAGEAAFWIIVVAVVFVAILVGGGVGGACAAARRQRQQAAGKAPAGQVAMAANTLRSFDSGERSKSGYEAAPGSAA